MRTKLLHTTSVVFLLCLLLAMPGWSQTRSSASTNKYTAFISTEDPEKRFDIFFDEGQQYVGISAYRWKEKIEDILNRINLQESLRAKPYYQTMLCRIYYDLGEFEDASQLANTLMLDEANLDLKVKRTLLKIADQVYFELKMYRKQLEVRKAQERLAEKVELYTVYENMGLYRQALADYEIRNPREAAKKLGNHKLAIYHKDRVDLERQDGGLMYTALQDYEQALTLIDEYINTQSAISEKEFREVVFLKGQILGGIGKCKLALKQYREAIPYLEEGVASGRTHEAGKFPYYTAEYWTDLADCYLKEARFDLAKNYLDSVERVGRLAPSNEMRFYHLKADYFLGTERPLLAADYLRKFSRGQDSLERVVLKEQYLGQLVAIDQDLETKMQLELTQRDLRRNRDELIERDKVIYLSIVALLFSLLCVVALIIAYLKSVKNKKLIENQKRIIEDSLVEKDSLLKEIHHRVKNNLQMVSSLLSLQSKNTRSRAAINALEEGQSRVKAMALIHQKLYQNDDLSVIEMQEYIESLVASIHSIFKKEGYQTNIHINAEQTKLDVDRAIPIGLILNELVSNSFKYAFAENKEGNIYIRLENKGEEYAFEYKDDGKGLPDDFEQTSVGSMGLRLIKRLANQLRSNLQIDTKASGARFWFNFG